MKKRILAVLLIVCMVLPLLPITAAAVITALCFRLRNRENQKKDGADKPTRHEQEEENQ